MKDENASIITILYMMFLKTAVSEACVNFLYLGLSYFLM